MANEELSKIVENLVRALGEHFDAVQILASNNRDDGAGWECIKRGTGNYFARIGMAKELLDECMAEKNPFSRWRIMQAELLDQGWIETTTTPERGCAYVVRWRSPDKRMYIESIREAWAIMKKGHIVINTGK